GALEPDLDRQRAGSHHRLPHTLAPAADPARSRLHAGVPKPPGRGGSGATALRCGLPWRVRQDQPDPAHREHHFLAQSSMIRRRATPDGRPYRVYERKGLRTYSIGYKQPDGKWAFRYSCSADDRAKVAELRAKAIGEAALLGHGVRTAGQVDELITAWFKS